jgi:hypothetical protein
MNHQRDGFVLVTVVLVIMVAAAVTAGAAVLGANTYLMTQYKDRQGLLQSVAEAGVEEGRARLNGDRTLYPKSGHVAIEDGVPVVDANGATIPGIRRYTYAGPIGDTTGQYGVFGTVVSVAEAPNGDRFVRRMEVLQESFAKYAYFTNAEPSNIAFGSGDQIFGPTHSNGILKIYSSGAMFHDVVTTAETISGEQYATFRLGYTEHVRRIHMPETVDLTRLQTYAEQGGTAIVSTTSGGPGQATTRIEFISIDLNGDGDTRDADEGFMRVYQNTTTAGPAWITAHRPSTGNIRDSKQCGDIHDDGFFYSAASHGTSGTDASGTHSWYYALQSMPSRRCYLGGDPRIWHDGFTAGPDEMGGRWLPWNGPVDPRLVALGRPDAQYLFPITRALNPNFKGVVFVDGKVAVSGTLRGRLTLAATSSIIIADDIKYVTDPAAATCRDILGLFTGTDVIIADNTINAPQQVNGSTYYTLDDTRDEFIHGVVLALENFEVENYGTGPTSAEPCGTTTRGRGCLFLTGGIIQSTRGAVGTTSGTGYLKRYSYDPCAYSDPPPYFPTTGHFARSRLFDVDPTGFNPTALFALLKPTQ